MAQRHLVAVYVNTSQLDEPVYRRFSTLHAENRATIVYWNDFGLQRTKLDPELGVVPVFPDEPGRDQRYSRVWLDSRKYDATYVAKFVADLHPTVLILNDISLRAKIIIAGYSRLSGVRTGFRSDKNTISTFGEVGHAGWREQFFYKSMFDCFFNVGALSKSFYCWSGKAVMFPYPANADKFIATDLMGSRGRVRAQLSISSEATVLLSVIKFNAREGAAQTTDIYLQITAADEGTVVVFVGSGPMLEEMKARVSAHKLDRQFRFVGYVPYSDLQEYFFASDVFLHFARCEPWGVSVLDALCAGLGVVTSDQVGSGVEVLGGTPGFEDFVVSFERPDLAVARLRELIGGGPIPERFAAARARVLANYSVAATAQRLDEMVSSVG